MTKKQTKRLLGDNAKNDNFYIHTNIQKKFIRTH